MFLSHLSPDYQCTDLPDCEYRGQELLRRHRLGDDQEHQCWDKREHIRLYVWMIVFPVVGLDMAGDREFINRLLLHTEVFDIVQKLKHGKKVKKNITSFRLRRLHKLVMEEKNVYETEKNAKQKEKENRKLKLQIKSLLKQILSDDAYDTTALVTEILEHQTVVDAVKLWYDTEDQEEKMKAEKKMFSLLLPVILQYTLGEKVCERIRTQVGEERLGDISFIHKLLGTRRL